MACDARAVLIVTRQMEGTATNVAKQRIELHCSLPPEHSGPHRDATHAQEWVVVQGRPSMLFHEESD